MNDYWATDDLISLPEPVSPSTPVLASFGGFGFTMHGMVHDLTAADLEEISTPMFAPEGWRGTPYQGEIEGRRPRTDDDPRRT